PAAKGRVIDGTVFVAREIADIDGLKPPDAIGQGFAGERIAERPGKHLRENRQHHRRPGRCHAQAPSDCWGKSPSSSGSSTTILLPLMSITGTAAVVNGTIIVLPDGSAI